MTARAFVRVFYGVKQSVYGYSGHFAGRCDRHGVTKTWHKSYKSAVWCPVFQLAEGLANAMPSGLSYSESPCFLKCVV
jgi:hypothetical protein